LRTVRWPTKLVRGAPPQSTTGVGQRPVLPTPPALRAAATNHRPHPHVVVWAEHLEGWTAWEEIKDSEYITSGGASGGGGGDAACSAFYYEGNDDEVATEDAAGLVEAGTIQDETLIYSDQEAFPFEGWTAWSECSYLFGIGEPSAGVTAFYYEGNEDEVAAEDAAGLLEAGTIQDDTLIYSDQAAFPFEGWTAWSDCSYLFGIGEAPEGGGGGGGGALCSALYYEGCDDEVAFADVAALVEAGTIDDETFVFSDQDAFPFEGWTAWGECSEYFGEAAEEGGCTSLSYTNDGETTEEATADELPGLVAAGTITDETNVYSTDDGFTFEGWTEYGECKHLFASGEAEEGEAPEPEISEQAAGEVDETEKAEQAMKDTLGADQAKKAAEKAEAAAAEAAAKAEEEAAAAAAAAAKEEEEKAAKKAAMDKKRLELEEAKAAAKAEKEAAAKAIADAKAADEAARAEAGLAPVPTTISDDDLEALADAEFEEIFKMDKTKWGSLPPFRKPMVKKAAMQRWVESQEAENERRAAAWQKTKDDKAKALKSSADKRLAIGQFIAEKGYEALVSSSSRSVVSALVFSHFDAWFDSDTHAASAASAAAVVDNDDA
jgi:hypothetical protein